MRHNRLLAAAAALAAASPAPVMANPFTILGFDGHSMGRGGALTGGAEGPAAVYYNPAGLIKRKERQMTTSIIRTQGFLKYDPAANPDIGNLDFSKFPSLTTESAGCGADTRCHEDVEQYNEYVRDAAVSQRNYLRFAEDQAETTRNVRSLTGATVGLVVPLAYEPEEAVIAVGGAAFIPLGPILYQRFKGPNTPYFLKYDDTPHRVAIDAGAAVELWEVLRVGVGVDALVDLNADPSATAILPPELRIGGIPPDPNFADIRVFVDGGIEAPPSLAPTAGLQYSPAKWVDLGVSFRDEQSVEIQVASVITVMSPYGTKTIPVTLAAGGAFTPRQIAAGAQFSPFEGLSIMADITWQQWSNYKPAFAIEASIENAGDAACDVLRTFQDLDPLLDGVEDATGIEISTDDICDLTREINEISINTYDPSLISFEDVLVPAFGASYTKGRFNIAGGYRYEPTPVPGNQPGVYTILDSNTHVIGGNFAYQMFDWLSAGLWSQLRYLTTREITRERNQVLEETNFGDAFPDLNFSSANADLQALQAAVAGKQIYSPGYPSYTVGGSYLSFGLQLTSTF
jgi:long-subunit fatty acid transport protein